MIPLPIQQTDSFIKRTGPMTVLAETDPVLDAVRAAAKLRSRPDRIKGIISALFIPEHLILDRAEALMEECS